MDTKRIVLPLYDHATRDEVREILERLDELGFSRAPRFERWNEVVGKWQVETREEALDAYRERGADSDVEWSPSADFVKRDAIRELSDEELADALDADATPTSVLEALREEAGRRAKARHGYERSTRKFQVASGQRCICPDLGVTGHGQRHTLCRAHNEEVR